jgi:hypothetical protein
VHDAALDVAKRKSLVIAKKMIELMAVRRKRRLQIENGAEVLLDLADTFADPDLAAEPRLEDLGSREMVGMRVCFEDPC